MTQYTLSTKNKKSVVDKQIYTKGGKTIEYGEIYRFGTVSFSSENNPDFDPATFDLNNPNGFDVGQLDLDDHDYSDGVGDDIDFSPNMTQKEKDAVLKILEEHGGYEMGQILYKKGWSDDYETVFYGPLELTSDEVDETVGGGNWLEEGTALQGQYGHSGKLKPVEAQDQDMMDRIKFLAGITK